MNAVDAARLGLLRLLAERGYQFATPAPNTHRRILLRRGRVEARDLADIFGWNLPFRADVAGPEVMDLMAAGQMLAAQGETFASTLRVASLEPLLFLHSAFPPKPLDTVFFGPDSYRFADFIRAEMPASPATILDIGAGSGVGGLFAQRLAPGARLVLTDVNPRALALARVNAAFAGVEAELREGEGLTGMEDPIDLIVANPPYVGGGSGPTYSHGGGGLGGGISLQWAKAAMERLAPGGRLLLYTGSAMVRGGDLLREALAQAADAAGCAFSYRELDPDVFPGLLLKPAYWSVERIAAVGAVMTRPA